MNEKLKASYDGDRKMLYSPESKGFIAFEAGTGDNLLREDIREGYVDYVNWERFSLDAYTPEFIAEDGGMVMLKCDATDLTLGEVITAVMDSAEAGSNAILIS